MRTHGGGRVKTQKVMSSKRTRRYHISPTTTTLHDLRLALGTFTSFQFDTSLYILLCFILYFLYFPIFDHLSIYPAYLSPPILWDIIFFLFGASIFTCFMISLNISVIVKKINVTYNVGLYKGFVSPFKLSFRSHILF